MSPQTRISKTGTGFYDLVSDSFLNTYHIVTDEGTCRLMASPEVVGFDSYSAMVAPTIRALEILKERDARKFDRANILTILRGGLNYPVEEACSKCGIMVSDISFMSCERIIRDGIITGLDVKYEQVRTEPDNTLIIGDIIASGATLKLCLKHFVDIHRAKGHSIRKIVFFTVGGTKAIGMMEEMTAEIRTFWPDFEGFQCVFYEGIFTVYTDKGVTGVNTPDIDFGWKGAVLAPEFRKYIIEYGHAPALLEKCIIYDGGARRYQIDLHYEEVTDYWKALLNVAGEVDFRSFIAEKAGYGEATYEQWCELNCYLPSEDLKVIYDEEQEYVEALAKESLREICQTRLEQLKKDLGKYETNQ